MSGLGQWASERVSAAEMNLVWIIFVISAVALTTGCYWYMRAKMRPTGRDEPEAARPAPTTNGAPRGPAPRGGNGSKPPGTATRRWIYKTDESGRPRRFLNHREAAWWAARKVGTFFVPLLVSPVLWALFSPDEPYRWAAVVPLMTAVVCVWLVVIVTIYLYVALSGGVMDRAERKDRR